MNTEQLREKFFNECTSYGAGDLYQKTPLEVFEWFKPYLKPETVDTEFVYVPVYAPELPTVDDAYNVWCEVVSDDGYQFPLIPEATRFEKGKWKIEEKNEGKSVKVIVHCWLKYVPLSSITKTEQVSDEDIEKMAKDAAMKKYPDFGDDDWESHKIKAYNRDQWYKRSAFIAGYKASKHSEKDASESTTS